MPTTTAFRRPTRFALVVFLVPLVLGAAFLRAAADDDGVLEGAFLEASAPLWAGQPAVAAERLAAFRAAHPGTPEAVEAWVLQIRAHLLAAAPAPALAQARAFLDAHGAEAWTGRVRHFAAEAYERLGQPGEATTLLGALADEGTSPATLSALAERLRGEGDRDMDGVPDTDDLGRPFQRRNLLRATAAYERALALGPSEATQRHVLLRRTQLASEAGAHADVVTWATRLLEALGVVEKAGAGFAFDGPADRQVPVSQALQLRGSARLALGQRAPARADLLAALPLVARGDDAEAHRRVVEALATERFQTAAGGDAAAFEEGADRLRALIAARPAVAPSARLALAAAYHAAGRAEEAAAEHRAFVDRFPDHEDVPRARERAIGELVQAGRIEAAIGEVERFLAAHPDDGRWTAMRDLRVSLALRLATQRLEDGDRDGAVAAWRAFVQQWPDEARAPDALLAIAALHQEDGQDEAAMAIWREIGGRYASTPRAPAAALRLADRLEALGRLDEAIVQYEQLQQRHGRTPEGQEANARLDRLRAPHLTLTVPRVTARSEAASVKVATRNIQALDVRVHALDLKAWFLQRGSIAGIEDLALEIVKPEATARWALDPYVPFRLVETARDVAVDGAGAYVIVAGDEQLTATTLLLVSDIECVVKKGADNALFVWAFVRADQAPVEGAQVLVQDAKGIRELGRTGSDGTWSGRSVGAARHVLVAAGERGLASTELADARPGGAGFSTKAYLHTDRPVYRPGDTMAWRAVFLKAVNGAYVLPGVTQGTLEVLDARGDVLRTDEVTSTAYGTFDGSVALDTLAPLGAWTLRLTVPRVGTWTGSLRVESYRKPEIVLAVEPERPTYATGETVKASLRVTYTFGAPAADVPVRWEVWRQPRTYELPDPDDVGWYLGEARAEEARGSVRGLERVTVGDGRTDAAGRLAIEVATAEGDADGDLVLRAYISDITGRLFMDEGRIPVTRLDHVALLRADRTLVRPKQSLRLELRTVDARMTPVARSGEVILLRVLETTVETPDGKRQGRRPVAVEERTRREASWPLATREDGRAELDVTVPAAGRWRLRYEGRDGRGRLVVTETDVEARGEEEEGSKDARLLIARTIHREGDVAELLIRSPVRAARALLTIEGDDVLEHRFVALDGPSTFVRIPLTAAHAPNIVFAVAIPGPGRLLEATTGIVVLRTMDIRITAEPARARPGDEIALHVRTTDTQGQPVAAEIGLAVVDEAVFGIARDTTPPIRTWFQDRRRVHAVVTASSLGLLFHGTTREANRDLLDQQSALSGGALVEIQHALRLARVALDRGDTEEARRHVLKALDRDPTSWDGRELLRSLEEDRRRKGFQGAGDELARLADKRPGAAADDLLAHEPMLMDSEVAKDAKFEESLGESEGLSDAPFEGPQNNGTIGIGGGAGGAFRGRGGSRSSSARGGGGFKGPAAGVFFNDGSDGDFAARTEDIFDVALGSRFKTHAGLADLADLVPVFEVRRTFRDTAHWDPRVTTGADGEATVRVTLPDNLTRWRVDARGVSSTALVGAGRAGVEAGRPVVVRLDAPRFLIEGDQVVLPVAVHNHTEAALDGRATLVAEGVASQDPDGVVSVAPGVPKVIERRVAARDVTDVRLEAAFASAGGGDGVEVRLRTGARGIPWLDGRSGLVRTQGADEQVVTFDVPDDVIPGTARLEVVLAPSLAASLEDAVLRTRFFPYGCVEQTVHRFLPAVLAAQALEAAGAPDAVRRDDLARLLADGARRLVHMQNPDGSFGWFAGRPGDVAMTAYALRGLRLAVAQGQSFALPAARKAVGALDRLLPAGTPDEQALAHLARSEGGSLDPEAFALTYRRREDGLGAAGLAWLAVAAHKADRRHEADELVRILLARRVVDGDRTHWVGREGNDLTGSTFEATALAAWALVETKAATEHAERALSDLLARGGPRTTKEAAAFAELAAAWLREGRDQRFGGRLVLTMDDQPLRTITIAPGQAAPAERSFLVDDAVRLGAGRRRLALRLEGQGQLAYAVRLRAMRRADDLPAATNGLAVARRYLRPAERVEPGQPAPAVPGHTIWREAAQPRVEPEDLTLVGRGDAVLVRLEVRSAEARRYVLLEDPLPAGCEVLADSLVGPVAWQERRDDRQVVFLDALPQGTTTIEYLLQATHRGSFTALGTTAQAMYAPEVHGRGAGRSLAIGAPGAGRPTDGETTPTPDEQWASAVLAVTERRFQDARSQLEALRRQPLRDEILDELEALRLTTSIGLDDAAGIVEAREELVRRAPGRIPTTLDVRRAIARAYHRVGDAVVANSLYRDLVAQGFDLELEWAAALAERDRPAEGLDHVGLVLRGQPIANASAQAELKRAERYRETRRPKGRERPADLPMDAESIVALRHAGLFHAATAAEPVLRYALVDALRTTGREGEAAIEAEAFLQQHGDHHLMDDVRWFLAESRYRAFEAEPTAPRAAAVVEAVQPLLDREVPQPGGGRTRPSVHRPGAHHMLARVRHAQGQLDEAARLYRMAGSMEDAQAALAWLDEERLELPPTLLAPLPRPDSIPAAIRVPLVLRNIDRVAFEIYPVDLQVLFAVRRSLEGLHQIQLTGIRPQHAFDRTPARSRLERTEVIDLPAEVNGAGAWLVVARAGHRATSTLVLCTDLEVRLQLGAGRIHVTDAKGQPVRDAFVTVAEGQAIRLRGRTDARGILEAPGLGPQADVVVSAGERFGIARGR